MRPGPLFVAALIVCPAARALATTYANEPTLAVATGSTASFGQAVCSAGSGPAISYSFESSYTSGAKLLIYATAESSCADPDSLPNDAVVLLAETTLDTDNEADSLTVTGSKLVGTDCPSGRDVDYLVCAVTVVPTTSATTGATTEEVAYKVSLTITYDSVPPPTPVLVSATGGDSAAYLYWNTQDDTDHWVAYYRASGDPVDTSDETDCPDAGVASATNALTSTEDAGTDDAGTQATDAATFDASGYVTTTVSSDGTAGAGAVRGLTNGQPYEFVLVAVDEAGNESSPSNALVGTPMVVQDFYRRYRCAGGVETGGFGCSVASAPGLTPNLALLVVLLGLAKKAR